MEKNEFGTSHVPQKRRLQRIRPSEPKCFSKLSASAVRRPARKHERAAFGVQATTSEALRDDRNGRDILKNRRPTLTAADVQRDPATPARRTRRTGVTIIIAPYKLQLDVPQAGGPARLIGGSRRRRRRCARHHNISARFFFHGTWVGRYTVRRTPFVRAADPVSDNTSATDNRWVSDYRTFSAVSTTHSRSP